MSVGVVTHTLIYGNEYVLYSDLSYLSKITATCGCTRQPLCQIACAARFIASTVDPNELARFSDRQQFFLTVSKFLLSDRKQIFSDRQQISFTGQHILPECRNRTLIAVRKNC
jgi:hypothetical protein